MVEIGVRITKLISGTDRVSGRIRGGLRDGTGQALDVLGQGQREEQR